MTFQGERGDHFFREGVAGLGVTFEELLTCLGETCVDVYLNDRAYWRCVPKRVWTYTIGGYKLGHP